MTSVSTSAKHKPALDENSFQQLLAAAFVVQEHNEGQRAEIARPQAAPAGSTMAALESLVRARGPDVSASAKLIADRVLEMMGTTGVSISLISNGYLDCVAESGTPANIPGSSLASHSLVATERLKAGSIFESADSLNDIRLDRDLCHRLAVGSLVAAPIFRFNDLAGLIEVRWASENGFKESDVERCREIARLITEILEKPSLLSSKTPPAEAEMVDLARNITGADSQKHQTAVTPTQGSADDQMAEGDMSSGSQSSQSAGFTQRCRVCGRPFGADEAFCGYCSMPRAASSPSKELQSKWASLWYIQKAHHTLEKADEIAPPSSPPAPEPVTSARSPFLDSLGAVSEQGEADQLPGTDQFSYFKPLPEEHEANPELDLLDELSSRPRWFRSLREKLRLKDVMLILLAATLAFGVVSAWPTSRNRLTWFQSVMVRLGFAQGPIRPHSYTGDPASQVWVDVHTRLYYCPGSGLYGKTPEGYYVAQRDAQQQRIAPAAGLACQ